MATGDIKNTHNDFSNQYETRLNAELQHNFSSDSDSIVAPTPDSPGYARESALLRGLQVPAKSSHVSSGFKYPPILARADVSKESWSAFTQELSQHANMTPSQWLTTIGGALGALAVGNMMIGFLGVIPSVVVGHKMRKHREGLNLKAAVQSGALMTCVKRWNEDYFKSKGLVVRVDIPGEVSDKEVMDIMTSKLFQHQSNQDDPSIRRRHSDQKQLKYQKKEARMRMKAALKGRIVIIPLDEPNIRTLDPERIGRSPTMAADRAENDSIPLAKTEVGDEEISMFGRPVWPHNPMNMNSL